MRKICREICSCRYNRFGRWNKRKMVENSDERRERRDDFSFRLTRGSSMFFSNFVLELIEFSRSTSLSICFRQVCWVCACVEDRFLRYSYFIWTKQNKKLKEKNSFIESCLHHLEQHLEQHQWVKPMEIITKSTIRMNSNDRRWRKMFHKFVEFFDCWKRNIFRSF